MRSFALLALLLLIFCPTIAGAQTSVAVVNVQKLMTDSEAAKHIQKQVQDKREILQKEFLNYEQELREKERNLATNKEEMSQEEFLENRRDFETSLLERRKNAQSKKQTLEEEIVTAMRKLRTIIAKIVANIAEEKQYDLVFSNENVVIVDKNIDITDEVMSRLNSTLTKISVNERQK